MRYETLQAICDKSRNGMAEVAADGTFIKVNKRFGEIVGRSEFEMEGVLTFQRITYDADLDVDVEQARRVKEGIIPFYPIKKRYRTKTDDIVWVDLIVIGIFENGLFSHYAVECKPLMKFSVGSAVSDISKPDGFQPFKWIAANWKLLGAGTFMIGTIIAEIIRQMTRGAPHG